MAHRGISGGFETGLVQQISITDGTDDGVGVWIGMAKNKNLLMVDLPLSY